MARFCGDLIRLILFFVLKFIGVKTQQDSAILIEVYLLN